MPSFIRANRWTIPAADGTPKNRPVDIGNRSRAFGGGMLTDRRDRKREWRLTTNQVREQVAKAIEGVIAGLGDLLGFHTSFFSAKGVGPVAGSVRPPLFFGTGEDGFEVVDTAGSPFGLDRGWGYHVQRAAAVTNILSQNQRTAGEDGTTTGFVATFTASVAVDSTRKVQGRQSIRVTVGAALDGVTVATAAAAATAYVCAVYVRVDAACTIRLRLDDDVGFIVSTDYAGITPNKWHRLTATGTTAGGATAIAVTVSNQTTTDDFNIDANQIETGATPNGWIDAAFTARNLQYPVGLVTSAQDLTIAAWVLSTAAPPGAQQHVVSIPIRDGHIRIERNIFTTEIRLLTEDEDGLNTDILGPVTGAFDGTWHHIAAVFRCNPETNENVKSLFIDGVEVATSNPAKLPDLRFADAIWIGQTNNTSNWDDGQMADLQILPWAAPAQQILAWFDMGDTDGVRMPQSPRFYIDGNIMPDRELRILAVGETPNADFVVGHVESEQRSNNREVDMEISEA